jgi:hypothetical protein
MRFPKLWLAVVVSVLGAVVPSGSRADQPRDWMVAAQPGGTFANIDVVFPGVQAQLEHRRRIYGSANELTFKVNALPTLVFYESQADVDLRLLVLTLGASAGYREVLHNIEFAPGTFANGPTKFDSAARRDVDFGGRYNQASSGFGEGRATLSLPFNDHVVLVSVNGFRFEGGRDRTFDWRLGIVRDAGMLVRSDTTLFLKDRSFGAIGPQVQILNYGLDGIRNTQINYGFTFTTRLGLRDRNDLLFLSMLFGVGGTVNGVPTQEVYGNHLFKLPMTFQLAYRTVLELVPESKPGHSED